MIPSIQNTPIKQTAIEVRRLVDSFHFHDSERKLLNLGMVVRNAVKSPNAKNNIIRFILASFEYQYSIFEFILTPFGFHVGFNLFCIIGKSRLLVQ